MARATDTPRWCLSAGDAGSVRVEPSLVLLVPNLIIG
ncbi:hypothetical protein GGR03_002637 [Aurantimonas endophytica]|uniref:Uncharacterized protein n=1 Tax=Aurantimonas endophytica TaxID=1522175 RepID=A0A7W6HEH8_9HYPH|nr:hypothetical protein [Aurantimonas endophytica]